MVLDLGLVLFLINNLTLEQILMFEGLILSQSTVHVLVHSNI